jgi:hypothetical protein
MENLQAEIAACSWLSETEYIVQSLLLKAIVSESPWLSIYERGLEPLRGWEYA